MKKISHLAAVAILLLFTQNALAQTHEETINRICYSHINLLFDELDDLRLLQSKQNTDNKTDAALQEQINQSLLDIQKRFDWHKYEALYAKLDAAITRHQSQPSQALASAINELSKGIHEAAQAEFAEKFPAVIDTDAGKIKIIARFEYGSMISISMIFENPNNKYDIEPTLSFEIGSKDIKFHSINMDSPLHINPVTVPREALLTALHWKINDVSKKLVDCKHDTEYSSVFPTAAVVTEALLKDRIENREHYIKYAEVRYEDRKTKLRKAD